MITLLNRMLKTRLKVPSEPDIVGALGAALVAAGQEGGRLHVGYLSSY